MDARTVSILDGRNHLRWVEGLLRLLPEMLNRIVIRGVAEELNDGQGGLACGQVGAVPRGGAIARAILHEDERSVRLSEYVLQEVTAAPRRETRRRKVLGGAALIAVMLVIALLRVIRMNQSVDIYIDETIYVQISQTAGQTLHLQYTDGPVLVHPPLFFYMEGLFLDVFHATGPLIDRIFVGRYFVVLLSSLSGLLLTLMALRVSGRRAAVMTALFFAVDPLHLHGEQLVGRLITCLPF
jgi:hypothetical protein